MGHSSTKAANVTHGAATLAYLAGHSDFATTKRYVHPRLEVVRALVEKAREVQTPHKIRHSGKMEAASNAA